MPVCLRLVMGRQCASATGRLQAVAAPSSLASSSIIPQSPVLSVLCAADDDLASVRGTWPEAWVAENDFYPGYLLHIQCGNLCLSFACFGRVGVWVQGHHLIGYSGYVGKALPEKTFFFTVKPLTYRAGLLRLPPDRPSAGSNTGRYRFSAEVIGENDHCGAL